MRYSQPYGTPQPPLDNYPRYINGNPTTGTEGSIPPNTAFDEAQIEILNVITQVRDLTGDTANLNPSHTDLLQLWKALQHLFARKYITTPITKTVHTGPAGEPADFPDLFAALDWVQEYTITYTGSVTFLIGPGKWVYSETVECAHANSNRIFIQGAALKGAAPVPGNMSVTGYAPANRATDGSNQITYLRSIFATELAFTGGVTGIRTFTFGFTFRYLLITGSQTIDNTDPYGGRGIEIYEDTWYDIFAVWGFGDRGINIWNCNFRGATSGPCVSAFNGSHGVHTLGGGFIANNFSDCIFTSNGNSGFRGFGCWAWFARLTCKGNGGINMSTPQPGLDMMEGGFLDITIWADCSINAQSGVYAIGTVTLMMTHSYFQNNGQFGAILNGGSQAYFNSSTFSGNAGGYAIYCNLGSNVEAIGAALGGQNLNPIANTWGAANSYITL